MGRRTGEQTRALLLRVGMQMLLERGVAAGVQHIRLQDVLRRAGLTTGAAYRLWADQTDFQRDLAVEMVRSRPAEPTELERASVAEHLAVRPCLDEFIRLTAAANSHTALLVDDDPTAHALLIALALRASADTWPELKQAAQEHHRTSTAAFAAFYRPLMAAYGMRMREPLTVEQFAAAMQALGEGFAVGTLEGIEHAPIEAPEGGELPSGSWTLFAVCVRALVHEFMVPIDGEGDQELRGREDSDSRSDTIPHVPPGGSISG